MTESAAELRAAADAARERLGAHRRALVAVQQRKFYAGPRGATVRAATRERVRQEGLWQDGLERLLRDFHEKLDVDGAYLAARTSVDRAMAKKSRWGWLRKDAQDGQNNQNQNNNNGAASLADDVYFAMQGAHDEAAQRLAHGVNMESLEAGGVQTYIGMALGTGEQAGQYSLDHLGLDKTFAWAHPRAMGQDLFAVRGSKVIQGMYGNHVDRLAQMVARATDPRNPQTIDELRTSIQQEWPDLQRYQAQRIARTESAAVWTQTAANAYAANGIQGFESIIAHGPSIGIESEDPCGECVDAAAGGPFSIGDDLPPWHPNCRCEAVPVLETDETDQDSFDAATSDWEAAGSDPLTQPQPEDFTQTKQWLPPKEPWAGQALPVYGGDAPLDGGQYLLPMSVPGAASPGPEADLTNSIGSGVESREALGGGNQSESVDRVTFKDGTAGVVKKFKPVAGIRTAKMEADKEELAGAVARAIGTDVTPTVVRTADDEVTMRYVDGTPGTKVPGGDGMYAPIKGVSDTPSGLRVGILDLLTGQTDRDARNWILRKDGTVVAIDNANAFHYTRYVSGDEKDKLFGQEVLVGPSSPFTKDLVRQNKYGEITGYKDNPLTKRDIQVLRQRLRALEERFIAIQPDAEAGRTWFDEMMAQLDQLDAHATGKVDLIAGAADEAAAGTEEAGAVASTDLKAQMANNASKISRLRAKIAKETDQAKLAELNAKLDDQIRIRDNLRDQRAGGAATKPEPVKPAKKPKPAPEPVKPSLNWSHRYDVEHYMDTIPEDELVPVPAHTWFAGNSPYKNEGGFAYRHRGVIVKVEVSAKNVEYGKDYALAVKTRVDRLLDATSDTMRSRLRIVTVNKGESPDDAFFKKTYKNFGGAAAQAGDGQIHFWKGADNLVRNVFDHEMGHITGVNGGPINQGMWEAAQRADATYQKRALAGRPGTAPTMGHSMTLFNPKGVTDYGQNNIREDWAESVRLALESRNDMTGLAVGTPAGSRYAEAGYLVEDATFADLFPNRAKLVDEWLGLEPEEPILKLPEKPAAVGDPGEAARLGKRAASARHKLNHPEKYGRTAWSSTERAELQAKVDQLEAARREALSGVRKRRPRGRVRG